MTEQSGKSHWTLSMFVEHAELYMPFLEVRRERAVQETEILYGLFRDGGVPAHGRVLDLACGVGRHAIELAKLGYRVTGVDISPVFIERARELADEAGADVEFVVGDARSVGERLASFGPFDATINMFTSHGYYGRDEDVRMFRQVRDLSTAHAVLIVNAANRDRFMNGLMPEGSQEAGGVVIWEHRRLDMVTSSIANRWEFFRRHNGNLELQNTVEFRLRVYSLHEVIEMLGEAGWTHRVSYGMGAEVRLEEPSPAAHGLWVVASPETAGVSDV